MKMKSGSALDTDSEHSPLPRVISLYDNGNRRGGVNDGTKPEKPLSLPRVISAYLPTCSELSKRKGSKPRREKERRQSNKKKQATAILRMSISEHAKAKTKRRPSLPVQDVVSTTPTPYDDKLGSSDPGSHRVSFNVGEVEGENTALPSPPRSTTRRRSSTGEANRTKKEPGQRKERPPKRIDIRKLVASAMHGRSSSVEFIPDLEVGDVARPQDMAAGERTDLHKVGSLQVLDFAFIRRSDDCFTYAMIADRRDDRVLFVVDAEGRTKEVSAKRWASCIRLVNPERRQQDGSTTLRDSLRSSLFSLKKHRTDSGRTILSLFD